MKVRSLLVLLAAAAVASGCASTTAGTPVAAAPSSVPSTSASTGPGGCDVEIAFFGDLTGENSSLVVPIRDGVKLAFDDYAKAHPDCPVELMELDSQGKPEQALVLAQQATEQGVVGVIGGTFSGETKAAMPAYQEAGVAMVSPSASSGELSKSSTPVFHRVAISDDVVAKAAGNYVDDNFKARKVYLVDDGTAYGKDFTAAVKAAVDTPAGSSRIEPNAGKFPAVVTKIKAAKPDVVAFGGYFTDAGPLLKQLRAAGYRGKFLGGDGLYDPQFARLAGAKAAEGVIVACGCFPGAKADGDFATRFESATGSPPGIYAAEGYDAATVFLDAIAAGNRTPADVLAFVESYSNDGITRTIKFEPSGDLAIRSQTVWTYEIHDGELVPDTELQP